jgi:DNA-dependent RNA polymerase auxiliary subunit epsilon
MSLSNYKVSVSNIGGTLTTQKPISLRNVVREGSTTINNIELINNVEVVERVDGAILQYDAASGNYEVKQAELDGGTF